MKRPWHFCILRKNDQASPPPDNCRRDWRLSCLEEGQELSPVVSPLLHAASLPYRRSASSAWEKNGFEKKMPVLFGGDDAARAVLQQVPEKR
jgi:hypothetical protein